MDQLPPVPIDQAERRAERTLADILAAIQLVAAGGALRMVLAGLPDVDLIAGEALAQAQAAGVTFMLLRSAAGRRPTVIVGPIQP